VLAQPNDLERFNQLTSHDQSLENLYSRDNKPVFSDL
jgi:hypothetical protein